MSLTAPHKATAVFFLSLAGVVDTAWLSFLHLHGGAAGMCGPTTNCGEVLSSVFAQPFGIPLAFVGLGMYTLLLCLTFFAVIASRPVRWYAVMEFLAATGSLISLVLMVLQFFVLQAFCPFCTISAVTITGMWFLLRSQRRVKLREQAKHSSRGALYGSVALVGLLFGAMVFAWMQRPSVKGNAAVITVGSEVVTEEEMMKDLRLPHAETQRQLYESKVTWVDDRLVKLLLGKEAQRLGINPDTLLRREVYAKAAVSDSEVQAYFTQNYKSPENLLDQSLRIIRATLVQQKQQDRKSALVDSLRREVDVRVSLGPPPESAVFDIPIQGSPSRGSAQAAVTIVTFTDFECPFCARVAADLHQLEGEFRDVVRVVVKHFPLPIHEHAELAALAVECAGEQGKFWPYHDFLYAHQEELDRASLIKHAGSLGVQTDKFQQCLDEQKYFPLIQEDRRVGERLGVSGTPTLFMNGRALVGNYTLERLREEVGRTLGEVSAELDKAQDEEQHPH